METDATPCTGESSGPRGPSCMGPSQLRFENRSAYVNSSGVLLIGLKGRCEESLRRLRCGQSLGGQGIRPGVAAPINLREHRRRRLSAVGRGPPGLHGSATPQENGSFPKVLVREIRSRSDNLAKPTDTYLESVMIRRGLVRAAAAWIAA